MFDFNNRPAALVSDSAELTVHHYSDGLSGITTVQAHTPYHEFCTVSIYSPRVGASECNNASHSVLIIY